MNKISLRYNFILWECNMLGVGEQNKTAKCIFSKKYKYKSIRRIQNISTEVLILCRNLVKYIALKLFTLY